MRLTFAFIKRNALEMLRDPLLYVFCLGFPVVMIVLFEVIAAVASNALAIFSATSLIPGIIMFSFSFVMLMVSLLVSKDRKSAFLIRLYTSPMRTSDFVLGYALPSLAVGIGQEIVCILFGWIITLIAGGTFFSFGAAMLLMVQMLPMLVVNIFFGILFGTVMSDKSAPAISSVFISASGILGGAWMPLDTMGGFETFCRVLPFYPSVYTGRVITGAVHSDGALYAFDSVAKLGFIPLVVFLVAGVVLSVLAFGANMKHN